VLTFHVRSLAKERLVEKLGEITAEQLEQIKQGPVEVLRY
jgi:mRNA-degrading endonuclease toxin of MazEF toxin-antitoxin module